MKAVRQFASFIAVVLQLFSQVVLVESQGQAIWQVMKAAQGPE
jgi:hypothetical protein